MKIYSAHGFNDFVVLCGYKGHVIKSFFADYSLGSADVTFDLRNNQHGDPSQHVEPWSVTLVETGLDDDDRRPDQARRPLYQGRLLPLHLRRRRQRYRHHQHDRAFTGSTAGLATVTAVQPPGRFGAFTLPADESRIDSFKEKPQGDGAWINGGYFVLERKVLDLIDGDDTVFEQRPMRTLAHDGELHALRHTGFWQPMDTLRDKHVLEELWASGNAPWKKW